jgi:hypothetical protein
MMFVDLDVAPTELTGFWLEQNLAVLYLSSNYVLCVSSLFNSARSIH